MQKERGETIKPHSLRKILIEKTLASDRSIDGQINSIDLGVFGKEAEGLLKRSFADPKGRERGRLVIVTSLGDIQIQKKDIVGHLTKNGQELRVLFFFSSYRNIHSVPRPQRQNRFRAVTIHSHGKHDTPQSPRDLRGLFLDEYNTSACTASFVITSQRKILILRGSNTPDMSNEDIDAKIKDWESMLHKRVVKFTNPYEVIDRSMEMQPIAIHAFLRSIARKYDLRMFSCPVERNTATLESA